MKAVKKTSKHVAEEWLEEIDPHSVQERHRFDRKFQHKFQRFDPHSVQERHRFDRKFQHKFQRFVHSVSGANCEGEGEVREGLKVNESGAN